MDSVRIFCPGCSQVMEVKAPYANVVCPRCQMMILFKEEDIIQIQCDCGKLFSISYKYADREAICNDCSRKLFIPKFILDFSSSESSFQTEINEPLQFEKEVKIPLQFETDTNVPLQFEDEITTKNESIQPITIKNMSVESEEELIFGECQSVLNLWDDRILPTSIDLEFHQPIVPKSHEIVQYEENLSLLQSPNLPSNFLQIQENILFLFQKPIFFIPFLFFVVFLFYIVVSPVPKKNLHKNPKKVSYNLETNHIPWVEQNTEEKEEMHIISIETSSEEASSEEASLEETSVGETSLEEESSEEEDINKDDIVSLDDSISHFQQYYQSHNSFVKNVIQKVQELQNQYELLDCYPDYAVLFYNAKNEYEELENEYSVMANQLSTIENNVPFTMQEVAEKALTLHISLKKIVSHLTIVEKNCQESPVISAFENFEITKKIKKSDNLLDWIQLVESTPRWRQKLISILEPFSKEKWNLQKQKNMMEHVQQSFQDKFHNIFYATAFEYFQSWCSLTLPKKTLPYTTKIYLTMKDGRKLLGWRKSETKTDLTISLLNTKIKGRITIKKSDIEKRKNERVLEESYRLQEEYYKKMLMAFVDHDYVKVTDMCHHFDKKFPVSLYRQRELIGSIHPVLFFLFPSNFTQQLPNTFLQLQLCEICQGKLIVDCIACHGKGEIDCFMCEGKGKIYGEKKETKRRLCTRCKGKKTVSFLTTIRNQKVRKNIPCKD